MAITKAFKMSQGGLGSEILIDADGDTSITADTDDQIDIKVGGSDVGKITTAGIEGSNLVLLSSSVLGADASTIEITAATLTTDFTQHRLILKLRPKTDGQAVVIRVRDDSASLLTGVSNYGQQTYQGGGTDFNDSTVSGLSTDSQVGNATGENGLLILDIGHLRTAAKMTTILFSGLFAYDDAGIFVTGGVGVKVPEDNQGLSIFFGSGDIEAASEFALYGVKS